MTGIEIIQQARQPLNNYANRGPTYAISLRGISIAGIFSKCLIRLPIGVYVHQSGIPY